MQALIADKRKALGKNNSGDFILKDKLKKLGGGALIGIVNGLLGAGGGMIAVPMLGKFGLDAKRAHATSIAIILPLSAMSAAAYLIRGDVKFIDASVYFLPGAVGAVIGAWLLGKIPDRWLKRIFGAFMIWAGVRLLIR